MRRAVIYAHYDAEGKVRGYVTHYLQHLRGLCEQLVFCSTASLTDTERAKAAASCDEVIIRDNVGFDFGMWKRGLAEVNLETCDELVLTNSSVFGPLSPLAPFFEKMAARACDYWAMTSAEELGWHLQSYFLVFKRRVLRSEAFAEFWRCLLDLKDKQQVIRSYELGLSVFLRDSGFSGEACFDPDVVFPAAPLDRLFFRRGRNMNLYYPELLLGSGMPFVKVDVLRDNFAGIPLGELKKLIVASGYDPALIEFDRPPSAGSRRPHPYFLVQKALTAAALKATGMTPSTWRAKR